MQFILVLSASSAETDQDLEAFLIDFGSKAQGIIVVVDSASELSIDFFFCADLRTVNKNEELRLFPGVYLNY
jgi:hypothetical protein